MAAQPARDPFDAPSDVARDISLKMVAITRLQGKRFDRMMEGEGVTRAQWSVIVVAARHPGATQRLIAEALDVSEAAAGRMIERLCHDGLLERRPKQDDRRAHCVYLTNKAQPILERLGAIAAKLEAATFTGISADELAQLNALLARTYANIAS